MQNIRERFLKYLFQTCHCNTGDSFLLAVSGGVDSMVMMSLFREHGLNFALAHCNFMLRAKESDADEEFVRNAAREAGVKLYATSFDTYSYSKEKGISIQMAARELRYYWFDDLLQKLNFTYAATAHHCDDSVETFLINLSRGTGISGLTGIKPVSGRIIRPVLFLSREEIQSYAESMNIAWREDSSNRSVKYLRNKIRNLILPQINEILPGFNHAVLKTMTQVNDAKDMLEYFTGQFIRDAVTESGDRTEININRITRVPSPRILLYYILHKYGFNFDTVDNLAETLEGQPGRLFLSRTHELTIDRSLLIIQPRQSAVTAEIMIDEKTVALEYPMNLVFRHITDADSYVIPGDAAIASLDSDAVIYPLRLRKWKNGDYFYPLGMRGKKKLSDFFIDEKIPLPDKRKVYVLESGSNILWVVGLRIDDRYRVTPVTRNILQIIWKPDHHD